MTEIPPGSLIKLVSITHNLENDQFQQIPDYIGRFSETYEPNSIRVNDPDKRNGCVWFVSENNKWSRWQEYWADVDEAHNSEDQLRKILNLSNIGFAETDDAIIIGKSF